MQVDNIFSEFWVDTTTAPGTPLTSLNPTITIKESPGGTIVVNNAVMTNIGEGWYEYIFTSMDSNKNYVYSCNPGATAYITSGVTDKRMNNMDKSISDIRSGGVSFNLSGLQSSIRTLNDKTTKDIKEYIDTTAIKIENKIDSKNIDISPVIDKIDSIEFPEFKKEEKEVKKAQKMLEKLDKKITGYIDSEMKEKEELSAITREFTRLEMEDAKKEKEKEIEHKKMMEEKKKEEEMEDEKLMEEIKSEFERQDKEEKEKEKEELLKEIEEMKKEIEEKQKELNSL